MIALPGVRKNVSISLLTEMRREEHTEKDISKELMIFVIVKSTINSEKYLEKYIYM